MLQSLPRRPFTMAVGKHTQGAKRDRSNENFKKKWITLKKNGLNIHQTYDAEVYSTTERKLPAASARDRCRCCR
ncbi:hypothetical protein CDV31_016721 [Fusarium ambrosium]|uniref:Uncharacterized protein n=1 Tax=Fusarium ambrosium TaxID=131363 RepID=A0A428S3G9_9HYPO|nr:hypothetical protein CDV31_016721 [Fusarium ambrosium]